MTLRTETALDEIDWRILAELQRDGRLSFNELGRRVSLSSPSVAERVRKLESSGVITGYRAVIDPARAGQPVAAFIQMRCDRDRCLLKTTRASDYPEIVEIHKLSGDYCSMLRVRTSSMRHLESFLERIGRHGELRSSVVLSTQFEGRPVEPIEDAAHEVTASAGWGPPSTASTTDIKPVDRGLVRNRQSCEPGGPVTSGQTAPAPAPR